MQYLGYKVLKGRGICFIDDKKVKIKGSEVGFSLAEIEKRLKYQQYSVTNTGTAENYKNDKESKPIFINPEKQPQEKPLNNTNSTAIEIGEQVSGLLGQLLSTEYHSDYIDPELLRTLQKKKKKSALRR
jgi:hypothetical protein